MNRQEVIEFLVNHWGGDKHPYLGSMCVAMGTVGGIIEQMDSVKTERAVLNYFDLNHDIQRIVFEATESEKSDCDCGCNDPRASPPQKKPSSFLQTDSTMPEFPMQLQSTMQET